MKEKDPHILFACIEMALTDVDERRFSDYGTSLKEIYAFLDECEKRQFGYFKIIIPYLTIVWDGYWHQIVVGYGKYEISKYGRGCIFWKRLFGIFKPHHI